MIAAVLLRGWTVQPGGELEGALADWRPADPVDLPGDAWRVVRPIGTDEPVGAAHHLVVVSAPAEVDVMPGSQGVPGPPPPGARTTRVTLAKDDVLVVDARCWLRVAGAGRGVVTWQRI